MKEAQEHLPTGRVKRENSEAGDNAARPAAVDVFHSAPVAAFSIAGGSDEMDSRPKAALFVIHDNDAAPGQGGDVSGAAAARKANCFPVFLHPVGIEVAE